MRNLKTAPLLCIVCPTLSLVSCADAEHKKGTGSIDQRTVGKLVPAKEVDQQLVQKAREEYPLKVCLTSDEKLGSMGDSVEYMYREDGKQDRLVVFCCDGCEEDFLKEPRKFLAKLDSVKTSTANRASTAEHKGHH